MDGVMKKTCFSVFSVLVIFFFTGCSDEPEEEKCTSDEECGFSFYCNSVGECVQDCNPGDGSGCESGFRCSDVGKCVIFAPCEGIVCTTPPEDDCVDGVKRVFQGDGHCEIGSCVYYSADVVCDYGCLGTECANCSSNTDCPGSGEYCEEGSVVINLAQCTEGACELNSENEACDWGCQGGICKMNPCDEVQCAGPPPPECADGGVVTYEAEGTCIADGEDVYHCEFAEAGLENCDSGCTNGYCNDSPCAAVTCNESPEIACEESELLTYPEVGVCEVQGTEPVCTYTPNRQECQNGCGEGHCYECTTPEHCTAGPPSCNNTVYVTVAATCIDHLCGSQQFETECEHSCGLDGCVDPCLGVQCNEPPISACTSETARTTYASDGNCVPDQEHRPECVYEETSQDCADSGMICEDGGCVVPPVVTVDWCRVHFPPEITGIEGGEGVIYARVYEAGITDVTLNANDDAGEMTGEVGFGPHGSDPAEDSWTWTAASANQEFVGDPDEPNNDEFMGVITLPGEGTYDYAFRFTLDQETYLYCDQGISGSADGYSPENAGPLTVYGSDVCEPNPCNESPESSCTDWQTLVSYEAEGLCSVGDDGTPVCSYESTTVDCQNLGFICEEGSCVEGSEEVPVVIFNSDFSESARGPLIQGGRVGFHYDEQRLPNCRATYNGGKTWSILVYYMFEPGGEVNYVDIHRGNSYEPEWFVPVVEIPGNANKLVIWVQNNDRGSCNEYDSDFGLNYNFKIFPESVANDGVGWAGNWNFQIFHRDPPQSMGDIDPIYYFADLSGSEVTTYMAMEVYVAGLTDIGYENNTMEELARASMLRAEVFTTANESALEPEGEPEFRPKTLLYTGHSGNNWVYRWEYNDLTWGDPIPDAMYEYKFRYSTNGGADWNWYGLEDGEDRHIILSGDGTEGCALFGEHGFTPPEEHCSK